MATGGARQPIGGTKIIVNNLSKTIDADELKTMFSHFGTVTHANICTNRTDGRSMGYGFVDYSKAMDAAKAIEDMNGLQLGDKKLRVAYPEPVDDTVKNATKVMLKKLPVKYDEDKIQELCSKFGKVVKVRLLRDSVTNRSRACAFVFYEKWTDAQRAVEALNDFKPEGGTRNMAVKIDDTGPRVTPYNQTGGSRPAPYGARPQPHGGMHRPTPQSGHPYSSAPRPPSIPSYGTAGKGSVALFLYNIGEYVSEHEIHNIFAQFGGLVKIDIVRDPSTQLCKGYAFLTFENKGAAENAIYTIDGMMYRGRQLQLRYKNS